MAGLKALVALAFTGSVGMTMLILACALPEFGTWYPLINVVFYLLTVPLLLVARNARESANMASANSKEEAALFLTAAIVISAFALPVVLARAPGAEYLVKPFACGLTLVANLILFGTIFGFYVLFGGGGSDYSSW